jgi:hypothetical protein
MTRRLAAPSARLATVLDPGETFSELTRKHGLKLLLSMVRHPTELAGLDSLQVFLEAGFDHCSAMSRQRDAATYFMETIHARESAWIERLFDGAPGTCEAESNLALSNRTD